MIVPNTEVNMLARHLLCYLPLAWTLSFAFGSALWAQVAADSPPAAAVKKPLPASETIVVRNSDRPTRWTVHHDQLALYVPNPELVPELPRTIKVREVELTLEQESAKWRDLAIYRIAKGPLSREQQLLTARGVQQQFAWVKVAGAVIRLAGHPHLLLQQLSVRFQEGVSDEQAEQLHKRLGADRFRISRVSRSVHMVYSSKVPILDLIEAYEGRTDLVRWVAPEVITPYVAVPSSTSTSPIPWHHHNPGLGSDVLDADVDSPKAWAVTEGGNSIVIAIIDGGYERTHLEFNLWTNSAEQIGNPGVDDDGNGEVDDKCGYDFDNDKPDVDVESHGTQAAGSAAARGDNTFGIRGTCPGARLMLLQAKTQLGIGDAIEYATSMGADVICLPMGGLLKDDVLEAAVAGAINHGRGGKGCVVVSALEPAAEITPITDLAGVIAVRGSDPRDALAQMPLQVGHTLSVLAPGKRIATTKMATTLMPAPAYTWGFGGSSAATPITAGAAALLLSARGDLTWRQVRRLLQDTCDKADPMTAGYGMSSGYSEPAAQSTHGFGRINLWEAVRLVAPADLGGRDGVDVFLRDQRYDWGNTERPSNVLFDELASIVDHTQSPDIKVDSGPSFGALPGTSQAFDALADEAPRAGVPARIYVRVRNRGLETAPGVRVRVFETSAVVLPPLPLDSHGETAASAPGGGGWTPVGQAEVDIEYSGSSVANHPTLDGAAIVRFDWTPDSATTTMLAVVDCGADAVNTGETDVHLAVVRDNNLALRRYPMPAATTRASSVAPATREFRTRWRLPLLRRFRRR